MATAPVPARWKPPNLKCHWKLPVDRGRDAGLIVGDPASLKDFTLGTVDKNLRIVDCGNAVSKIMLVEAHRGRWQHIDSTFRIFIASGAECFSKVLSTTYLRLLL